ncbi:MAG: hypothetical protein HQL76_09585 [Magnetococcales bacterium]|nr:hypothetical protein [Magnetococcales bacterium]
MGANHRGAESTWGALAGTVTLGVLSGGLYLLLYLYEEQLELVANLIRQGQKGYVVIPIGIALVFSFVHGAFTGRFWDILGLKARK